MQLHLKTTYRKTISTLSSLIWNILTELITLTVVWTIILVRWVLAIVCIIWLIKIYSISFCHHYNDMNREQAKIAFFRFILMVISVCILIWVLCVLNWNCPFKVLSLKLILHRCFQLFFSLLLLSKDLFYWYHLNVINIKKVELLKFQRCCHHESALKKVT